MKVCLYGVLAMAVALVKVAASAQQEPGSPPEVTEADASRLLLGCPGEVRRRVLARDESGSETFFTSRDPWFVRSDTYWGDGADGMTSVSHTLVHPSSCFTIVVVETFETSSPFLRSFILEATGEVAPEFLIDPILGVETEPYSPAAARHGAALLLLETRARTGGEPNPEYVPCPAISDSSVGGVTPTEPLAATTEWVEGLPSPAHSVRHGSTVVLIGTQQARTTRWPGRWRLFAYSLRSRFGAEVIAVYDARLNRHRWVLATISCAVGRTDWLANDGDWFFGVTDAPADAATPQIIGLDARTGDARAFMLDELSDDDGLPTLYELCSGDPVAADDGCLDLSATRRGLIVSSCVSPRGSCRTREIGFDLLRRLVRRAQRLATRRQDQRP